MTTERLIEILQLCIEEILKRRIGNTNKMNLYGICSVLFYMRIETRMSFEEWTEIEDYIMKNRPISGVHCDKKRLEANNSCWWGLRLIRPRIAWLEYRIRIEKRKLKTE